MPTRAKGGGRKPKRPGTPLSRVQTFRLTAELDWRLRKASKESGRSIIEQIQFELEQPLKLRLDSTLAVARSSIARRPLARRRNRFQLKQTFEPTTPFALRADYEAVSSTSSLAFGDIVRKDHPEFDPLYTTKSLPSRRSEYVSSVADHRGTAADARKIRAGPSRC
jgi:hypothetical protein